MLDIAKEATFKRPVKAQVPDGEGYREETFSATFRVLPGDLVKKLLDAEGSVAFLRATIISMDDIEENKTPLTYSDELRDRVLALPHLQIALIKTYFDEVGGAKLGN